MITLLGRDPQASVRQIAKVHAGRLPRSRGGLGGVFIFAGTGPVVSWAPTKTTGSRCEASS